MRNWLTMLVVCLAAVAGVTTAQRTWSLTRTMTAERASLERELRELRSIRAEAAARAARVRGWNDLWQRVDAAGMRPHDWFVYPVNISRGVANDELPQAMNLLENICVNDRTYRFLPQRLELSSASTAEQGQSADTAEADSQTTVPETDTLIDIPADGYVLRLSGTLFISKRPGSAP